ncbi:MAG: PAS domain S-box protein [Candidatus Schekmanbacteria bacterium]|nr:PAS domain S-box protein [Candidatus Schekmanbacteria bacterium]
MNTTTHPHLGLMLRYGLAVGATAAAMILRQVLEVWVGHGLPAYITFYPIIMVIALLGGLGPVLLATVFSDVIVAYWILSPVGQFAITSPVDRLGLVVFSSMGLFMGVVSVIYQRYRNKATEYDREAVVRANRERLAAFAEATFEGIVESEKGRIVDCNVQFARMMGYSITELKGMEMANLIVPEDQDRVIENTQQYRKSAIEHVMLRKDGTRVVVEAQGSLISLGSTRQHIALRDITESKRMEEELLHRQEDLSRAQEVGSMGSWRLDVRRNVLTWTDENYHIFGIPRGTPLTYETFLSTVHPDDREYVDTQWKAGLRGEPYDIEHRLVVDGSIKWVREKAYLEFDKNGVLLGGFGITQDITERKKTEDALRKATADLARSNEELKQFAYVASHDLQEPLRSISSFLKLLESRYKDSLDDNAREYIGYAVDGAVRMSQLISGMLDLSRMDLNAKNLRPTDSGAALAAALANLHITIQRDSATVTCNKLPLVLADGTLLTQIFQNLVGNAIKFRSPDRPNKVQIGSEKRDHHWLFWVRDNGIGIDAKHLERIFLIFQRLHTRQEYPGTGMGLAICKKIVDWHGGTIWVESKLGEGSTFFFTLPEK